MLETALRQRNRARIAPPKSAGVNNCADRIANCKEKFRQVERVRIASRRPPRNKMRHSELSVSQRRRISQSRRTCLSERRHCQYGVACSARPQRPRVASLPLHSFNSRLIASLSFAFQPRSGRDPIARVGARRRPGFEGATEPGRGLKGRDSSRVAEGARLAERNYLAPSQIRPYGGIGAL